MKNINKAEIIISEKFQANMRNLNMYAHLTKRSEASYKGSVKKVADDLYILCDTEGRDICGILDQKSFIEALMETDVAHLWINNNKQQPGASN